MNFMYEGKEWDTDQHICVAGYISDMRWYPIFRGNREEMAEMMETRIRKLRPSVAYINEVVFGYNEELQKSYVKGFYVNCKGSILSDSSDIYIIGRSHEEVMEILRNERII